MAQNFNLSKLGQHLNVNTSANVAGVNTTISVGNATINTVINSSSITVTTIVANGGIGSATNILSTNGTAIYWGAGPVSNAVYMKGGAATIGTLAAGGSNIFRVNANTLSYNTTIATGENASATGPITVDPGITLTVETGARVSIV